jgi:hypothetical protein
MILTWKILYDTTTLCKIWRSLRLNTTKYSRTSLMKMALLSVSQTVSASIIRGRSQNNLWHDTGRGTDVPRRVFWVTQQQIKWGYRLAAQWDTAAGSLLISIEGRQGDAKKGQVWCAKISSSFPFPFVPLQRRGCLVAPLFLWIALVPFAGD